MTKIERIQEDQSIEGITQAHVEEIRGHARKAIHIVQQRMAQERDSVTNRLDLTMMIM